MKTLNPNTEILNNIKASNSKVLNLGTLGFGNYLEIRNLKLEFTPERIL